MNNLLIALLFSASAIAPSHAAATKDDGATLGTSSSPQVERQQRNTDKGSTDVYQNGVPDAAGNLGNAENPQVKDQRHRTERDSAERPAKRYKNQVLRNKDEKAGSTKGNPVQPSEYESAPPATTH